MIKMLFTRAVSVLMIVIFFGGCVSTTKMHINTTDLNGKPVEDATVFIDGVFIGQTPNASKRVSNFNGKDTQIIVAKEGYSTVRTAADKEVKAANLVFGVLLNFFAWFWIYGPKEQQNVILTSEPATE